ncbi:MAG: GroES family chaperonin [Candidatus Nanoarchaeia archaeon]
MTNIQPLQDNVLLKKVESQPSQEEKVQGGIIVPNEEKPITYGEIINISKQLTNCELQKGDNVLFSEYGGKKILIDNEEYVLLPYKDISGIITFDN